MSAIYPAYFFDLWQTDSSQEKDHVGEVCIANISPIERQRQLRFGIHQFFVTLVILAILIALHVNPLWRLALPSLFWASAVGYFQARDKT